MVAIGSAQYKCHNSYKITMSSQHPSEGSLFASMDETNVEEKKDSRRKDFLNLASEGDIKRRQHDFHDELRKKRR